MGDHGKKRTKGAPWGDHNESSQTRERDAGSAPRDPDELLDETSADSFPASDPPSFTPTKVGTGRDHEDGGVERERPSSGDQRGDDVERETP